MSGEHICTWRIVVKLTKWNYIYKMNEVDYFNMNGEEDI